MTWVAESQNAGRCASRGITHVDETYLAPTHSAPTPWSYRTNEQTPHVAHTDRPTQNNYVLVHSWKCIPQLPHRRAVTLVLQTRAVLRVSTEMRAQRSKGTGKKSKYNPPPPRPAAPRPPHPSWGCTHLMLMERIRLRRYASGLKADRPTESPVRRTSLFTLAFCAASRMFIVPM